MTQNLVSINTYGAILIPLENMQEQEQATAKEKATLKGQLKSAFKQAGQNIKQGFTNVGQELKEAANALLSGDVSKMTPIMSKFSGIAVAQTLMDGKVSSKEALDYLFMGFAPALGVQGSLMGYSGLNQLKDSLSNGSINVGAFINGLARVIKGGNDLKNQLLQKDTNSKYQIIEIDLTMSHTETYQSETPDRRVQNGQSLNEYVHNLPLTIDVECALQNNKRYSESEFRAIIGEIRKNKKTVLLQMGDEQFEDLILTDFSPNTDCTKSGYDYTLSFKKILWSEISTNQQVTIQKIPIKVDDTQKIVSSGGLGTTPKVQMPDIKEPNTSIGKEVEDFLCKPETAQQYTSPADATLLYIGREAFQKGR